jgi:uncharacterized protein YodC (DUF2158 family)
MSASETPSFSTGDVVVLKGQDVKMTVERSSGNVTECAWFAGAGLKRGPFLSDTLQKVAA